MKKTENYRNGVRIRTHFRSSTKITEDGLYVEKEYTDHNDGDKKKIYHPTIYTDRNGLRYITNKQLGNLYIQDLVADCFCPPKPDDEGDYVIVHKDGRPWNDNYRNLCWEERAKAYPDKDASHEKSVSLKNGFVVKRNGTIYRNGKKLQIFCSLPDRDLGMIVPVSPRVEYEVERWNRYYTEHVDVDILMAEAGYVKGNSMRFRNPVILHRNGDWMDFRSENLEWTDRSDPEYVRYYNRTADTMNALGQKWNKDWNQLDGGKRYKYI